MAGLLFPVGKTKVVSKGTWSELVLDCHQEWRASVPLTCLVSHGGQVVVNTPAMHIGTLASPAHWLS
eukprot:4734832-Prorocentrum_lima.AAC.1